jgi:HD superfamily phosphohydrolase
MTRWLSQPIDTLELKDYLAADDDVLNYHIHRWAEAEDAILADLCQRFLQRNLFKVLEITRCSESDQQQLLMQTRQAVQDLGWHGHYYCGLHRHSTRGYTLYEKGILVQTDQGIREINELSPLVQSLSQAQTRNWLIYPRELTAKVMAWLPKV